MTDWWGGARRVGQQLSLILLFCPPITPWYNPCNGRDKKSLSCPLQHRSNKHKSQKIHIQAMTKNLNLARCIRMARFPNLLAFHNYDNDYTLLRKMEQKNISVEKFCLCCGDSIHSGSQLEMRGNDRSRFQNGR